MAFSEEQEAQILDMMGKMGEFLTKQSESKEEKKEPEKKMKDCLMKQKRTWKKRAIKKKAKPTLKRHWIST